MDDAPLPVVRPALLRAWNRLAPGAGIILAGRSGEGLLLGLLAAAGANLAIASWWIAPQSAGRLGQIVSVAAAALAWLAAQVRLERALRRGLTARRSAARRAALAEAQRWHRMGEHQRALAALAPLLPASADDLLVSYRLAQVLTAARDVPGARRAWGQVRRLDPRGIYRADARAAERWLEQLEELEGGSDKTTRGG